MKEVFYALMLLVFLAVLIWEYKTTRSTITYLLIAAGVLAAGISYVLTYGG